MHTDWTLNIFDEMTTLIGAEFHAFTDKTCPAFATKELAREADARKRRGLKKAEDKGRVPIHLDSASNEQSGKKIPQRRRKKFHLRSYKYHSLGDYADMIRQFGTADSFSTEPAGSDYFSYACSNP